MKKERKNPLLWRALEAFLESESQLVVASIDADGNLIESNGGLDRLFRTAGRRLPDNLHDFLEEYSSSVLRRSLDSIRNQDQGDELRSVKFQKCTLHFKTGSSAVHTLSCFLCRNGEQFAFFAERRHMTDSDIIEKMSHMNNELANLSRELSRKNLELEKANETITRLMHTDVLTGLPNRRSVMERLRDLVVDAQSKGESLSVVMADLDHFKEINDTWGHAAGDRVLEAFGRLLLEGLREEDLPGRIGGEEFLVLLPGMGEDEAFQCAERIRKMVESMELKYPPRQITASFGVSSLKKGQSMDDVIHRADEALYDAKTSGRNRVEKAR